jgi:type II secretory pathway pseudopilin PulG
MKLEPHRSIPAQTDHRLTGTSRAGFTLIEILLVVGLMLIVFGMAIPSMRRALGRGPLQEWAQQFRESAHDARISAIDTGLIYQLRYEVGGRYFVAIPYEQDSESLSGESEEASGGTVPKTMGQMYEALTFQGVDGENVAGERLEQEWFDGLPDQSRLSDAVWSPAIKFYPDGSAEDAQLEIIDERKQAIGISIRGLTGGVTVSPVFIAEDR